VVSRVGVDIDTHDGYRALVVFLAAGQFGHARFFYTRHGFHIEVELVEPMSYEAALDVRRLLGDCPDRLGVDERRVAQGSDLRRFDTLFVGRLKGGVCFTRREVRPLACGPYSEASVDGVRVEDGAVGGSEARGGEGGGVA